MKSVGGTNHYCNNFEYIIRKTKRNRLVESGLMMLLKPYNNILFLLLLKTTGPSPTT